MHQSASQSTAGLCRGGSLGVWLWVLELNAPSSHIGFFLFYLPELFCCCFCQYFVIFKVILFISLLKTLCRIDVNIWSKFSVSLLFIHVLHFCRFFLSFSNVLMFSVFCLFAYVVQTLFLMAETCHHSKKTVTANRKKRNYIKKK